MSDINKEKDISMSAISQYYSSVCRSKIPLDYKKFELIHDFLMVQLRDLELLLHHDCFKDGELDYIKKTLTKIGQDHISKSLKYDMFYRKIKRVINELNKIEKEKMGEF